MGKRIGIRAAIRKFIRESNNPPEYPEVHVTMADKAVPFGCPDCIQDLEHRIEDNKRQRDACPGRTDAREHYNGVLKVLRRDLRAARKINEVEGGCA